MPRVARRRPATDGRGVRIDGNILAEPFRCAEQGLQFDLLHGTVGTGAAADLPDSPENILVGERAEPLRDLRLLLDEVEFAEIVNDLQVFPQFSHSLLDGRASVGQRQHGHNLGEVRVGRRANE